MIYCIKEKVLPKQATEKIEDEIEINIINIYKDNLNNLIEVCKSYGIELFLDYAWQFENPKNTDIYTLSKDEKIALWENAKFSLSDNEF